MEAGGISTPLMMWITPLEALMLAVVTCATLPLPSVMFTWPPFLLTVRSAPLTVLTDPTGRLDDV